MPKDQTDANTAENSSYSAQTDANAVNPSNTDATAAEPTMLDAMNAAVEATENSANSSNEDGTDPSELPDAKALEGKKQDGESETDLDDVPFHDHPRWKEVLQERDGYKGRITELEAQVEEGGELQTQLDTYMDQTGMDTDSFSELLNLGKLYRTDRAGFVEAMKPLIAEVNGMTGDTLPDDLQAEVDEGRLDGDIARELAAKRSENEFLTKQRENFAKQREGDVARNAEAESARRVDAFKGELRSVHDNWVDYQRKNDPDFSKLEKMILGEARSIQMAQTVQIQKSGDWATVLEQAKANVKSQVSALLGKKGNMSHITPAGGSDPGAASPAPKTMREAMEQSIHRSG